MTDTKQWCPRCKIGKMGEGKAIEQTRSVGIGDFSNSEVGMTMSPGGPGRLINCMKCDMCGHSIRIIGSKNEQGERDV